MQKQVFEPACLRFIRTMQETSIREVWEYVRTSETIGYLRHQRRLSWSCEDGLNKLDTFGMENAEFVDNLVIDTEEVKSHFAHVQCTEGIVHN